MKLNFYKEKIFIVLIFVFFFSFLLVSALDVADNPTTDNVKGVNMIIPDAPINYSLIPTVNSSDFWDNLNTPADINVGDLGNGNAYVINSNLSWFVPYTGATANVDLGVFNFTTSGTIFTGIIEEASEDDGISIGTALSSGEISILNQVDMNNKKIKEVAQIDSSVDTFWILAQSGGDFGGIEIGYTGEFPDVATLSAKTLSVDLMDIFGVRDLNMTRDLITTGGGISIDSDNEKLFLGEGPDASIYYNGTDMLINPQETGTGGIYVDTGELTIVGTDKAGINQGKAEDVLVVTGGRGGEGVAPGNPGGNGSSIILTAGDGGMATPDSYGYGGDIKLTSGDSGIGTLDGGDIILLTGGPNSGNGDSGDIFLTTGSIGGSGSYGNIILVKNGGLVGINTSTPANALNVVGDLNVTGTSYLGNIVVSSENITVNNLLNLSQDYILINSKLGIMTSTPEETLDVIGNALIQKETDGGETYLTIRNTAGSGSVDETASILFQQVTGSNAGKIVTGREEDYGTPSERSSYMEFWTTNNNVQQLALKIDKTMVADFQENNLRTGGNIMLDIDQAKLLLGASQDASIYFDGSQMNINPAETGTQGIAIGVITRMVSTGDNSIAMGDVRAGGNIVSTGDGSFAGGHSSSSTITSSSFGSFAFGQADGYDINASGIGSIAFGSAMTNDIVSTGTGSIAIGDDVEALDDYAWALGQSFDNNVSQSFCVGFGGKDLCVNGTQTDVIGDLNVVGDLNVTGTSYLGDLVMNSDNITVNNILNKSNSAVKVWSDLDVVADLDVTDDITMTGKFTNILNSNDQIGLVIQSTTNPIIDNMQIGMDMDLHFGDRDIGNYGGIGAGVDIDMTDSGIYTGSIPVYYKRTYAIDSNLIADGNHNGTGAFVFDEVLGGVYSNVQSSGRTITAEDLSIYTTAFIGTSVNAETFNNAGGQYTVYNKGIAINAYTAGITLTAGSLTTNTYGAWINSMGGLEGNSNNYGIYLNQIYGADNNYAIWDGSGSNWALDADNQKILLGEAQDASIYFTGEYLEINPAEVGNNGTAIGYRTGGGGFKPSNYGSLVLGVSDGAIVTASGEGSIAGGRAYADLGPAPITASGDGSIAYGFSEGLGGANSIQALGNGALAMGAGSDGEIIANGDGAMAFGVALSDNLNATGEATFALGKNFDNNVANSFAVGFGQKDFEVWSGNVRVNGDLNVTGEHHGRYFCFDFRDYSTLVINGNVTRNLLETCNTGDDCAFQVSHDGSLTDFSINVDTVGTYTTYPEWTVMIEGADTTLQLTLGNNTRNNYTTQARGTDTFSAGDLIKIKAGNKVGSPMYHGTFDICGYYDN